MKKILPISKKFTLSVVEGLNVNKTKGFTLIELLVVVAIIAVLAVMGFAAFSGLTGRGNDDRRKADIKAISDALEVTRSNATDSTVYSTVPATAFTGGTVPKEPTGRTQKYCYGESATAQIPNPAAWSTGICPTSSTTVNLDGVTSIVVGANIKYYKVCTVDEAKTAVICFGSRQ